jgi:2-polyprenyl-3-methyl-5-hydroxy-6-metoxy-1,4-benzoquinol methylase
MQNNTQELTTKEAWDLISSSYQQGVQISLEDVHYGPFCQGEKDLHLLDDVTKKNIVEIGCGGGHNSIVLSKWGAKVIGIDFSKEQIDYAKRLSEDECCSVQFILGNIEDLNFIPETSADIVLSVFALEYIKQFDKLCLQVSKILRPDGIFVFSDLHPFVSGGDVLNIASPDFWKRLNYFERRGIEFEWEFSSEIKGTLTRFHRTIEDNITSLIGAGLIIEEIREPIFKNMDPLNDPYIDETLLEECTYWCRIPYTIIFKARKPRIVIT